MNGIRWVLRLGFVPFVLLGGNALALTLVSMGGHHVWLAALIVGVIFVSFLVERLIPYNPDWNLSHQDRWRDRVHFVVNEGANFLSILGLPFLAALLPNFGVWPSHWPLWGQLLLAIGIVDFGITMAHFASHRINWLWRFHAVHHSVKRMYGFNGLMKHPLHQLIEGVCGVLPVILLGVPQDVAWLLVVAIALQLLLQHSNADVRVGPFKYVLALAPAHRFHHLISAREGDVNFGLFTMVWDWLLGTASFDPNRTFTSDDLGIEGEPDYPTDYWSQLIRPFKSMR
ncbi:sterol desaturase family protein [Maricaulis maris]|uniref:Sterol desaturase/sphingolipid hydroxylase (Fatty acid hydroxylase superfamily) n=1 Tax=Maricaulis maris TaxID=74318 RepID=A0A495CXN1_9PROT|nr:sterol desaturase family protein [Maricaulis maris]RKQ89531.1 sterol desaturase/sphingolipid hydroxylase (fatty acid hydroxylase superfamily) [Maricaulis maris]